MTAVETADMRQRATRPRARVRRLLSRGMFSATFGATVTGLLFGFVLLATPASASTPIDIRGIWAAVTSTEGSQYPQTITFVTENFKTGALAGTDTGGGAAFTVTGKISGSTVAIDVDEQGASYTSHWVGTVHSSGGKLAMIGTFTDNAGHQGGTFTATLTTPATGNGNTASTNSTSTGLGPIPSACSASTPAPTPCTYNSRDGALTFTPSVVKIGGTVVAKMVSPGGTSGGNSWAWANLSGLTAQNCSPSAETCHYLATTLTGSPGARYVVGVVNGNSVQGPWSSGQAYAVTDTTTSDGNSNYLDVRGLWEGNYVAPGGATYVNDVNFGTEDFSNGQLTGIDNGTDGATNVAGSISGRTITVTLSQPPSYVAHVVWIISADGKKLVAGGITDPTAESSFVLFRHGPPVAPSNPVTSGAGVTSGPAPITALPTPAEAFSSPARIVASAIVSIAALLFITFPANLFNKTFEENYDVIVAWWEPRLRRLRRLWRNRASTGGVENNGAGNDGNRNDGTEGNASLRRERLIFAAVVIAGAILGGLLNPKFGANSASANSFIATLLSVVTATALGAAVNIAYRRAKGYDLARHFQALPAGLAIAVACVFLSRVSDFQPGYLYGVVCGVAFAGALARNESAHLVALGHLATIVVAVAAWFLWVPVNHAAMHHTGVFPLVILDDLLASLFVGGLVGSVINLIPVRFMPGHTLASWHRGVWTAVFGAATFGMTEIVLFPSTHNHAGHAPIITIIALFIVFGGGSLAFREYFSRRAKRIELAAAAAADHNDGGDSNDDRSDDVPPPDPTAAPIRNATPTPHAQPVPTPRPDEDDQTERTPPNADPTT